MKKILAIIAATLMSAGVSHGAAIDWTISGMNTALKDYLGNTAANTPVYLILADSTNVAKITDVASETEFETALAGITVASVTTDSDGKKPSTTTATFESSLLTAGTSYTFGMLYTAKDAEGNGYYRLLANTTTTSAYDASDPSSSQLVSLSWSNMGKADWKTGYTAVPEPSTAALALAGLALLLKRRRA